MKVKIIIKSCKFQFGYSDFFYLILTAYQIMLSYVKKENSQLTRKIFCKQHEANSEDI